PPPLLRRVLPFCPQDTTPKRDRQWALPLGLLYPGADCRSTMYSRLHLFSEEDVGMNGGIEPTGDLELFERLTRQLEVDGSQIVVQLCHFCGANDCRGYARSAYHPI